MTNDQTHTINSTLGWIAVVLSVLALFLAWSAYNRTGTDVRTQVMRTGEQAYDASREGLDSLQAQVRLQELRADLASGVELENAEETVATVRQDLARAYQNSTEVTQEQWQEVQRDLDQLEDQLRNGSADALQTVEGLIERTQRDLRTDEE